MFAAVREAGCGWGVGYHHTMIRVAASSPLTRRSATPAPQTCLLEAETSDRRRKAATLSAP